MTRDSTPDHLAEFCAAIVDALQRHSKPWFNPRHGLCANYIRFLETEHRIEDVNTKREAFNKLNRLFQRVYGTTCFPFNMDPNPDYYDESKAGRLYDNCERLAFIHRFAKRELDHGI